MAREREILASLNHPNIARLYDAGVTADGQPYLALERIQGVALDTYADRVRLGPRARLRLFLQVAAAVAYAHGQLIVHRDIKPSNILVNDEGQVRLLDFGIAKLLGGSDNPNLEVTIAGERSFTPAYASPEQIKGEPLGIGTDIYSLAMVLYRLLCGRSPYRTEDGSWSALEQAILHTDPLPPSEAAAGTAERGALRGDIDTILLKALCKDPADRYLTVDAFADDIRRHLAGLPVRAQPDRLGYRLGKFIKRNRPAVTAAAAVSFSVIVGAGVAIWQASVALEQQSRAEAVKDFIVSIFQDADPYSEGAETLSAVGLVKQAAARLDEQNRLEPEVRGELYDIVGTTLSNLDDHHAAAEILGRATPEATATLGPDHPQTSAMRVSLAMVRRHLRQLDGLADELEALVAQARRAGSSRQEHLKRALTESAHVALAEGRSEDARALATEAFTLSKVIYGEGALPTVENANLLAVTHQFGLPPEEGLKVAESTYDYVMKVLHDRPRHALALDMRATYARALSRNGRFREVIPVLEGVVRDARDLFGPSSQMVGYFSSGLSEAYAEIGRFEPAFEAVDTHVRVLSALTSTASADAGAGMMRRGMIALSARRNQQALTDLVRSKAILGSTLGDKHPATILAQARHILAASRAGQFDAARGAIERLETPPPMFVARVGYYVGMALRVMGDTDLALVRQKSALAALGTNEKAERERMRILTELGLNQLDAGQLDDAESSFRTALPLFDQFQDVVTPARADALGGLARIALARGDAARAVALLETTHAFWQDFQQSGTDAARTTQWLRKAYTAAGQPAKARALVGPAGPALSRPAK